MKPPIRHVPGVLTVEAFPDITVSFDAALNTIEIKKGNRVIRTDVAPLRYSAVQFVKTLQRVRDHYQKGGKA